MKNKEAIKRVGAIIKQYRENNILSQDDLAKKCSLHRNQISQIERGLSDFRFTTLLTIIKVLNIPSREIEKLKKHINTHNET